MNKRATESWMSEHSESNVRVGTPARAAGAGAMGQKDGAKDGLQVS